MIQHGPPAARSARHTRSPPRSCIPRSRTGVEGRRTRPVGVRTALVRATRGNDRHPRGRACEASRTPERLACAVRPEGAPGATIGQRPRRSGARQSAVRRRRLSRNTSFVPSPRTCPRRVGRGRGSFEIHTRVIEKHACRRRRRLGPVGRGDPFLRGDDPEVRRRAARGGRCEADRRAGARVDPLSGGPGAGFRPRARRPSDDPPLMQPLLNLSPGIVCRPVQAGETICHPRFRRGCAAHCRTASRRARRPSALRSLGS